MLRLNTLNMLIVHLDFFFYWGGIACWSLLPTLGLFVFSFLSVGVVYIFWIWALCYVLQISLPTCDLPLCSFSFLLLSFFLSSKYIMICLHAQKFLILMQLSLFIFFLVSGFYMLLKKSFLSSGHEDKSSILPSSSELPNMAATCGYLNES